MNTPAFADWRFITLVDDARATERADPSFFVDRVHALRAANDLHAHETTVQRLHLVYRGPPVLDAWMKPWYPKVVEAHPDTEALVAQRWREYFPKGIVTMGDPHRAHI